MDGWMMLTFADSFTHPPHPPTQGRSSLALQRGERFGVVAGDVTEDYMYGGRRQGVDDDEKLDQTAMFVIRLMGQGL